MMMVRETDREENVVCTMPMLFYSFSPFNKNVFRSLSLSFTPFSPIFLLQKDGFAAARLLLYFPAACCSYSI